MGFFEIYTSNLTFPFQKPIYPLIQKLKVIQNLMLVNFFKFFGIRSSLWGKQKNINLTSYHLFNVMSNIIKIWHFFQERFCSMEEIYKNASKFCHGHDSVDFCRMWIYSAMAFPPLGNYNHIDVSVSIDFAINSKQDAPFHHIAYDYSCADWNVFVII